MELIYNSKQPIIKPVKKIHSLLAQEGSYSFIGAPFNDSVYNGLFYFDSLDMIKLVHDIRLTSDINKVIRYPKKTKFVSSKGSYDIFIRKGVHCIQFYGDEKAVLSLDFRRAYDMNTHDRIHKVSTFELNNLFVAKIISKPGEFFIVSDKPILFSPNWVERFCEYDSLRGQSGSWWVLDGLSLSKQSRVCIGKELDKTMGVLLNSVNWVDLSDEFYDLTKQLLTESLSELLIDFSGDPSIIAGYPWFFQVWSRDEAISLIGLLSLKKYDLVAQILIRQLKLLRHDGHLPNRFPSSDLGSSDAHGWMWFVFSELLSQSPETLPVDTWQLVYDKLSDSISKQQLHNNLVYNGPNETWMDTSGGTTDTREGYCIEIQALFLRTLYFHKMLSDYLGLSSKFDSLYLKVLGTVRKLFFKNGILADRLNDFTIRPNVFLAAYAYWPLFSEKEWTDIFSNFKRLFSSWGGLYTIDPQDKLFVGHHTGINDRSYHRGDSWYFINNIAGLCLLRLKDKFQPEIIKLLSASINDLLFLGAAGRCSEISSGNEQVPFGCFHQAWSCSSLLAFLLRFRYSGLSLNTNASFMSWSV